MSLVMYRKSDRVPVQFTSGEDTFTMFFSPLTMAEKGQFVSFAQSGTQDPMVMLDFAKNVLAATLKSVQGINLPDGSAYQLEFVEGKVSPACIDDLMNLEMVNTIIKVATRFISGIPSNGQVNDEQGKPMEGVIVKKS